MTAIEKTIDSTLESACQSKTLVCDGNEAAAWGVALSRPDVIAVYPITPQSSLVEYVSQFVAEGIIDAELMNVEGEHSVLSALQGAALAGARTYTATCGPGLAFMFEPYIRTPGLRLPIVASLVTRDTLTPQCVWGGHQDAMLVKEAGWIQMYCETVQEVLDTTVMAYRIGEHPDVMLPVNVNSDGNYLSYGVTGISLPAAPLVDAFLGEKNVNWHAALDPERPMAIDPLTGGAGGPGPKMFVNYRKGQTDAMQNALRVIEETHKDWGDRIGRHYSPLVEEYRLADADYAIVTIGSMTGAAKDAVDEARDRGEAVGLIKVKTFRPFPVAAINRALNKVKAIGVVDRSVNFGWNCGPLYQETIAAAQKLQRFMPSASFIGGLAGADITVEHFSEVIEDTAKLLKGHSYDEPVWINRND
ncbi:NADH-dependent phenylglyoxylate dehydrogenase subunit alpha [Motiliproteus sp. MSK22-1]|uniref:NADH-dependent phenylglyoxylate dehydrogenase subunit alpha n=1 Tax=Motiliproteus sp. MSK22-1 TaxID=1897630 RepID=UPI0009784B99|nr:phenylglyoxylate dehydrogenase [Motiliproteus sp. MSK22-1]OMH29183.1 phenylglyoxylate dehydrogenase [Motiliproteus sp. MSK22-1]